MRVSAGHSDVQPEPLKPAVTIKKSITPDYIICLEDGKKFKSLKRHLRTQYNMTPSSIATNGSTGGLPDGGPELRRGTFAARQADGPRPAAATAQIACERVPHAGSTPRVPASHGPTTGSVLHGRSGTRAKTKPLLRARRAHRRGCARTIDRKPFERCGVRCSRRPRPSNTAIASVDRISRAGFPE